MDIAIVSPSPKPFAMGGIEKLMLGLYVNMDQHTNHRVELIKLPTEENSFWNLIQSYEQFYKLDVSHFDMIISCKYPAWMIQHSNHVVYMAHRLRGLYDTYHFLGLPNNLERTAYKEINDILSYINDSNNYRKRLEPLFAMLNSLKANQSKLPSEFFAFPGVLIKSIVHFLDNWALHPSRVAKYYAISENVKNRESYFPKNAAVDVVYPPTSLVGLQEGKYDYFLMVGRLDGAKRVQLVVEAMKFVKDKAARLVIAGSGPEEQMLKRLAGNDERIVFLGYTNNEKLKELYRDARAVIYVPYDEDYGLVTIEAMHCAKPVITCLDSGGTKEFVKEGKTGFIAEANPKSLADKMNKILGYDETRIREIGKQAQKLVEPITWQKTINRLVSEESVSMVDHQKRKKKITVLSTYPVFPRKHGGQVRIYNLYKNLDKEYDITIVSFNDQPHYYEKQIGNLKEISIPRAPKHQEEEWKFEKEIGIPVTDVVMEKLSVLTEDYHRIAMGQIKESDILIASHPYLFHIIEPFKDEKYVIYDSHNVEYDLKKTMYPHNSASAKVLEDLFDLERRACKYSQLIFACSKADKERFEELYKVSKEKIILVPNGVDTSVNSYVSYEERLENKQRAGISDEIIGVFIGSWHKPNLEAVEEILKLAPRLPEVKFVIIGGQCLAFHDIVPPQNVVFAGIVEDHLKSYIYSVADFGINPMVNGSGTNLKIAEYMSCGLPVISTPVGARGYGFENYKHLLISEIEQFGEKIRELRENVELQQKLSKGGHEYILANYEWKSISERLIASLRYEFVKPRENGGGAFANP